MTALLLDKTKSYFNHNSFLCFTDCMLLCTLEKALIYNMPPLLVMVHKCLNQWSSVPQGLSQAQRRTILEASLLFGLWYFRQLLCCMLDFLRSMTGDANPKDHQARQTSLKSGRNGAMAQCFMMLEQRSVHHPLLALDEAFLCLWQARIRSTPSGS